MYLLITKRICYILNYLHVCLPILKLVINFINMKYTKELSRIIYRDHEMDISIAKKYLSILLL